MPIAPTVFISYSHKDKVWKDRLLTHLQISEKEGLLELWDDRRIAAGTEWHSEIQTAIDTADIGILLISADFLVSDFIRGEEIPRMLERRSKNGMRLFPVMVRSCDWQIVSWLAPIQIRPTGARPLADFRGDRRDAEMAAIAREVRGILESKASTSAVPQTAFPTLLPLSNSSTTAREGFLQPKLVQANTSLHEIDNVNPEERDDVSGQIAPAHRTSFRLAIGLIAMAILTISVIGGEKLRNLRQAEQQGAQKKPDDLSSLFHKADSWGDVAKKVSPAVVRIRCLFRLRVPIVAAAHSTDEISSKEVLLQEEGSGILVRPGLVLTAKRVVEPWKVNFRDWEELQKIGWKAEYDELDVQFEKQQPIKATLVASSDNFDLSLIQIRPTTTYEVPIVASNSAISMNDRIAVISYPATLGKKPSQVKALSRSSTDFSHTTDIMPTFIMGKIAHPIIGSAGPIFVTFDSAVTHGSSGGAVVSHKGELIGMVSQQFKQSKSIIVEGQTIGMNEPVNGSNIAVSPDDIRAFLRECGVL